MPSTWHIYMIRTNTGALYTGISTDVEQRFKAHQSGRGSKFLRAQSNLQLVYQCELGSRSTASKAEYQLKQRTKAEKEHLIQKDIQGGQLLNFLGVSSQIK